ncbi:hypothetical protein KY389_08080, partial [Paracoccus bogoriensis]|uniref:hypothetical protein n=1 Tax=Paracoccus bogoriensis TaxID=242065 RepID=UPI001CA5B8B0
MLVTIRPDRYPFHRHGSRLLILQSGMRMRVSASQGQGSTALRLAVSTRAQAKAAALAPASEPTKMGFPALRDDAHAAFSRAVIQFQDAVIEVGAQAFHAGQGMASDGVGQRLQQGSAFATRPVRLKRSRSSPSRSKKPRDLGHRSPRRSRLETDRPSALPSVPVW